MRREKGWSSVRASTDFLTWATRCEIDHPLVKPCLVSEGARGLVSNHVIAAGTLQVLFSLPKSCVGKLTKFQIANSGTPI